MTGKENYGISYRDEDGEIKIVKVQYLADLQEKIKELLGKKNIYQITIGKIEYNEVSNG